MTQLNLTKPLCFDSKEQVKAEFVGYTTDNLAIFYCPSMKNTAIRNKDGSPLPKHCGVAIINVPPKPETRTISINVYPHAITGHKSKDIADAWATGERLAYKEVTITFTPGEGLD